MGHLSLSGWSIYGVMGWAFISLNGWGIYDLMGSLMGGAVMKKQAAVSFGNMLKKC